MSFLSACVLSIISLIVVRAIDPRDKYVTFLLSERAVYSVTIEYETENEKLPSKCRISRNHKSRVSEKRQNAR